MESDRNKKRRKDFSLGEQIFLVFPDNREEPIVSSKKRVREEIKNVITPGTNFLEEQFKDVCAEIAVLEKLVETVEEEFDETMDKYPSAAIALASILRRVNVPFPDSGISNMEDLRALIRRQEEKKKTILQRIAEESNLFHPSEIQVALDVREGEQEEIKTLSEWNKIYYYELSEIKDNLETQMYYLSGDSEEEKYKRVLEFPENEEVKNILEKKYELFTWKDFLEHLEFLKSFS
ncbi:hypothetical protein K9L27_00305 [Candidatus Gracilibacteria bacterium]|nr:hypothetical protein [Candidatus Gracilibacteria bacterium]